MECIVNLRKCLVSLGSIASLLFITSTHAALFYQTNQDAAGLGDAQSGKAVSNDATSEFYNPAGLAQVTDQQLVLGANIAMPDYHFDGSTTYSNDTTTQTSTGTAHSVHSYRLPYLHYAAPISDKWAFGFGTSSPFKMNTNWGSDSTVSTVAQQTYFTTYDISTDLAYRPIKQLSIGLGYDLVRIISSDYDYATPYDSGSNTYTTDANGYSWSHAWHTGLLYMINDTNRIGMSYHSPINFTSEGSAAALSDNGATLSATDSYKIDGTLPATSTISLFHKINSMWSLQSSVGYQQWDQFSNVTFYNVPTDTGIVAQETIDYHLKNTWSTAVGLHYQLNPKVMLRTGLAYESSPVDDDTVYIQSPSDQVYTVSIGVHVMTSEEWAFDFGWSHLFYADENVETTSSTSQNDTTIEGTIDSSQDILGASFTWNMP
jgi:long-chain fatty acid transport protein